ncbi:MAG: ribose ABC transporter permease [Bacteroidetes bacterium]|jgi:ribose transport system permease protein|nr:ribose ABC transporter permease [Bacteroidota bacterium]
MEKNDLLKNLGKFQSLIALALMVILLTSMTDRFLTTDNMWNVLRQISVNLCISVGMTLVILTAGIDLSVGSILAFSGAVAAGLLKNGVALQNANTFIGFTAFGAIVGALLAGYTLGWFNGLMVTRFKVPAFVATLAMLTIARGFTMLWTGGFPITGLGETFAFIGTGWFLGVPMPVWITIIIVFAAHILTTKTVIGRHIYAVGGNETATMLSGVNVKRVKIFVYTIAGVLAAVGGILTTSRLDSAQPNAGLTFELDAIAAVVIGGTSLSGGKGSIMGTVQGALVIGILNNGLVLLNVSPFWQQVVKGLVILLAVILDKLNTQKTD